MSPNPFEAERVWQLLESGDHEDARKGAPGSRKNLQRGSGGSSKMDVPMQ